MGQRANIQFQIFDNTDNSIVGELDIQSSDTFPVALTYTIKDVQDIQKSKGSFSKNFKIPATRNNNDVLKSIFSDSFYNSFEFVENKSAKIFVDGSLIMQGQFKIKATIQDKIPQEYECVVFGENYEWVNLLDQADLCEIDLDAGGLFPNTPSVIGYDRDDIMATWNHNFSGHIVGGVGTHVVYPLVNTGKYLYGDFAHADDLFPAIFVRDIILAAFAGIGYQVESDFFETNWFKKLITLTPRQIFEIDEDSEVATPFSWQYATNPDVAGGWKIPTNYRNLSQPPNNFDGAIGFLPTPSCTGCDPNNVVSANNTLNDVKFYSLGGYLDDNEPDHIICGWWWGQFGIYAPAQNYFGNYFNALLTSYCDPSTGMWIWGHEWDCVWTNAQTNVYLNASQPPPNGTHEEPINNVSIIQTSQTGTYSFNLNCLLEMDNQYVIDNLPEQFEPFGDDTNMPPYYQNQGFMYANAVGMSYGGTDPQTGLDEYEDFGVIYCASAFLVQIEGSTGRHKPMFCDHTCRTSDDLAWHNFFAQWRSSAQLPETNLTFQLNVENFLFDILDTDDQFYWYVEVYEQFMNASDSGYSGGISHIATCQCKYRIIEASTWGGLTDAMTEDGQVSVSQLLPCDVSQLEWINGLTGLFNLYWYADEGAKKIYCEPRDNFFFNRFLALDWSEKIDMSQDSRSEFVYDSLNRNLCFSYEDDGSDGFVEERNKRVGQICSLNSFAMDLGNLYKNDDTQIGSEFYAPTYMFNDVVIGNNADKSPYIPVIHSEYTPIWTATLNNQYPDKIEEFAPRILLWGGKVPVFEADGLTPDNVWRWGQENPSDPPVNLQYYPFAGTHFNQNENFFGNLNIGGINYFPTLPFQDAEANDQPPASTAPLYPFCDGLFKVFWEKNINGLLARPRIKKAFFNLTPKDIMDFDFRKLIYLDAGVTEGGTYWIVNKIIDYKPAKNELTRVELYQFFISKPEKKPKPNKKNNNKFLVSNAGISRDVPNGRNYQYNIRLRNNADKLGVTGKQLESLAKTPNLSLTSPVYQSDQNWIEIQREFPNKKPIVSTDGSRNPRSNKSKKSFSIGSGNQVIQDTGSIVIGNNTRANSKNTIQIGSNVNQVRRNPEQIIVQGSNYAPAFVVNNQGEFVEGGGGCIYYEDAAGSFMQVYYEDKTSPLFEKSIKKVLKGK
tara:strand:+ start:10894 stop:14409 length:3516 start_codon:yes stop_codon:yes gene_type:complete